MVVGWTTSLSFSEFKTLERKQFHLIYLSANFSVLQVPYDKRKETCLTAQGSRAQDNWTDIFRNKHEMSVLILNSF